MPNLLPMIIMLHVGAGVVAVAAGAGALLWRKGGRRHVTAGRVFLGTMLFSAGAGALLGLSDADAYYITFHAGVLATTLIISGALSARAHAGSFGVPSIIPTIIPTIIIGGVNLANAAALLFAGVVATGQPEFLLFGFHAEDYFFLSAMAILAVIGDATLWFRRPLPERHRIARHLWRMGLGFFIAAGSAFTGPGAKVFPQEIRESGILSAPEFIILALIIFWLARTLFWNPPIKTGEARR